MLDYGIIGNCKTCALISKQGSIDWFCFPEFDSPSVFAKIIDEEKGGFFTIIPQEPHKISQRYIPNTNVIETIFQSGKTSFKIVDFFPRYKKIIPDGRKKLFRQNKLIRIVKPIIGNPRIKVIYEPKLNYAIGGDTHEITADYIITRNNDAKIILTSNINNNLANHEYFELDSTKYFVIEKLDEEKIKTERKRTAMHYQILLSWTKKYWNGWVSSLILPEKYKKLIIRSALLLKTLTFSETGAIIAAATTSIPEEIGSERSFDYRYCWVRDASFTCDALKKIGRNYEAKQLLDFIITNTIKKKKNMQIMYSIRGETIIEEKILDHLSGFMNSKFVRIGNAAYNQKQNDIYGSVIDIIYLSSVYYEHEKEMRSKYWKLLKYLVKEIRKNWKEKDSSIWEFRGLQDNYTYSKMICFVGMDRASRIAEYYDKMKLNKKWVEIRDEIRDDIIKQAWDNEKNSFTIAYGNKNLDASLLLMSYHEFLEANNPMVISTIKAIDNDLREGSLVQRYKMSDDFGKSASSFTICSFWLVQALFNIGEKGRAQKLFEELIKYSNHLGLFSEDIDIKTKSLCGNFPQAYTHIAMMNAAILLSEWASKRKKHEKSWDEEIRWI